MRSRWSRSQHPPRSSKLLAVAPPRDGTKGPDEAPRSSVERSLEEFIARANAVAAPASPPPGTTVLDPPSMTPPERSPERSPGSIDKHDRTEIVERPLPYTPPGRRTTWLLVALAFAAGGIAVVLAVRLVAPRPAPPMSPTTPILPPVIVIPQPTVEKLPEPAAAPAPAPAPAAAPAPADEPKTAPAKPRRAAKKPDKDGKAPSGLVDPFAE